MKIYISGPITNNSSCDKDFSEASKFLRQEGYDVVNPMLICPPKDLRFTHQREEAASRGDWNYYMREAIKKLVECDEIYMLLGWKESRGARLEKYIAESLGLTVLFERVSDEKTKQATT